MSGSIGFGPVDLYQQYAAKETTYAESTLNANAQDSSLVAYFNAHAASITTPDQLLGNYKLLTVVLAAFNLQSSIKDTALLKQLMTQDPSSKSSLAQKLGNAQYQLFAQALSNWSTPPFATAAARAQLVQSYTTNTFETQADTKAAGLSDALYFTREAPQIRSISALQSDPRLLKVAVITTGITYNQYVELGFTQQTSLLQSKVKISQFQTPSYVKHLAEQYLIQQSSTGSNAAPAPGSTAALFSDGSSSDASSSILDILDPGASSSSSSNSSGGVLSLFA